LKIEDLKLKICGVASLHHFKESVYILTTRRRRTLNIQSSIENLQYNWFDPIFCHKKHQNNLQAPKSAASSPPGQISR
jgi:hypothetical protein